MPAPVRLLIYDRTCTRAPFLTQSWVAGAALGRLRGHISAARGASSWAEALDWVGEFEPEREIAEVQYWGHGKWGCAYVDNDLLDARALEPGHHLEAKLARIRERMTPDASWWFRCCETFGAQVGLDFAQAFTDYLGHRAAGHTYIIGPWQSGLHSLAPGVRPDWSASEGIKAGDAADPREALWSRVWHPKTIACLRMKIPEGW